MRPVAREVGRRSSGRTNQGTRHNRHAGDGRFDLLIAFFLAEAFGPREGQFVPHQGNARMTAHTAITTAGDLDCGSGKRVEIDRLAARPRRLLGRAQPLCGRDNGRSDRLRSRVQTPSGLLEDAVALAQQRDRGGSGDRLDSAHVGGRRPLADDLEDADLGRRADVGAATELA